MKTKVLMYADCSADSIQAQNRDAKHFAIYLDKSKYEVTLFCKGTPDPRLIGKENINICCLNSRFKMVRISKYLYHLFLRKYDIILLEYGDKMTVNYLKVRRKITRLNPTKLVYGIVNLFPYEDRRLSDNIVKNSDHIFSISRKIADCVRKTYNIDSKLVHLCYDLSLFKPIKHINQRKKVVCVNSLYAAKKQPFLFVNLAAQLPEADFFWIGDGYYMPYIIEKIETENLKNVFFVGRKVQTELADFLGRSDIFVSTSIHEGFPNAIVEAMASGLPVIAFENYGPEANINDETGYIVRSEFEMLEKLSRLLRDEQTLERLSQNARKRAFRYEGLNCVKELECFFEGIIKKSNKLSNYR